MNSEFRFLGRWPSAPPHPVLSWPTVCLVRSNWNCSTFSKQISPLAASNSEIKRLQRQPRHLEEASMSENKLSSSEKGSSEKGWSRRELGFSVKGRALEFQEFLPSRLKRQPSLRFPVRSCYSSFLACASISSARARTRRSSVKLTQRTTLEASTRNSAGRAISCPSGPAPAWRSS